MQPAASPNVPSMIPRAAPRAHFPQHATPRLSVVVVNYRQWRQTARLTRQLLNSRCGSTGAAEVVIVDNGSPMHPVRRRLRRARGVSLRRWGRNHGFARGVNEGCRISRGQWFLLLNPDVTVEPEFLDMAFQYACRVQAEDPRAGVIGFQVRDWNGHLQPSAGRYPTLANTLLGLLKKRSVRRCQPMPGSRRRQVPWVSGCCLLIRRDCFDQLGGFDREYFLYYEDVDFCRRARCAGWSVRYEPALQVTHHHPLHSRRVTPRLRLLTRHALLTYARKHWPKRHFQALSLLVWTEAVARRRWEQAHGRYASSAVFCRLRRIAADSLWGRFEKARCRLLRVLGARGCKVRRTEGRARPQLASRPGPACDDPS